jgi:hypothetical protein
MNTKTFFRILLTAAAVILASGCATKAPYDYSAFKESRPRSIVVLPPINKSPEIPATYSVLSYATRPLAEAGYYVMPVTLVAEAFKENGMTEPTDMHATSAEKLRQIFGADAALYITISRYGTVYQVVNSESLVAAQANLVDLKTGKTLWSGAAQASSAESDSNQSGSLAVLLISAIIKQVVASTTDHSHQIAGVATARLLYPRPNGGLLYGPRSPNYGKD